MTLKKGDKVLYLRETGGNPSMKILTIMLVFGLVCIICGCNSPNIYNRPTIVMVSCPDNYSILVQQRSINGGLRVGDIEGFALSCTTVAGDKYFFVSSVEADGLSKQNNLSIGNVSFHKCDDYSCYGSEEVKE
jgi:hypothetical protein